MESVQSTNVNFAKFLALDESQATTTNPKWNCCDVKLKMLEKGVHADITLRAKGGSVKAHKCVLACVSPAFKAMFQHDLIVQLTSIVDIPGMTIDAVQLFLLMLYTTKEAGNETIHVNSLQMPHLVSAIDKHFSEIYDAVLAYKVESRLGSVLLSALARNLTPENCWDYYDYSLRRGTSLPFTESSISVCKEYVLTNYHEVIKSSKFLGEMTSNSGRVHRVIKKAESEDARNVALENFLRIKRL